MRLKKLFALPILLLATNVLARTTNDTLKKNIRIGSDAGNKQGYSNPVREEYQEKVTLAGLIPDVIILLNYKQVINREQYLTIKKNGDLLKQYTIQNKEPVGEVQQIMIVETKNKERYKEMKIE